MAGVGRVATTVAKAAALSPLTGAVVPAAKSPVVTQAAKIASANTQVVSVAKPSPVVSEMAKLAAANTPVIAIAKPVNQAAAAKAISTISTYQPSVGNSLTLPDAPQKKVGRAAYQPGQKMDSFGRPTLKDPTVPGPQLPSIPISPAAEAVAANQKAIEDAAATAAMMRGHRDSRTVGTPSDSPATPPAATDGGPLPPFYDGSSGGSNSAALPADLLGDSAPGPDNSAPQDPAIIPGTTVATAPNGTAVTAPPVTAPTTVPGLFHRLLVFLGFVKDPLPVAALPAATTTVHGEEFNRTSIKAAAESVVRRVRAGDQNAMGVMALVRDNAAVGDPRAKLSMMYMRKYIEANPIGGVGSAQIGSEYDEGIQWELGG